MNWTDLWAQTAFASVVSDLSKSDTPGLSKIHPNVLQATKDSDAAVFHSGSHYLFKERR